tara:strand:+ start:157 stop:450 length:294 start_codon:yes stop_codon:yes gene_type:complete
MENIEKGAKRKCSKCGTLFFDFGRYPLTCPNCGADVNSLLTNVSKRGRPPKNSKPEIVEETKDLKIDEIEVEEVNEEDDTEDSNVDDIVEIERESES